MNSSKFGKTGSGSPFNKVTHNGQECGIADVAGMCNQLCIGAINPMSATVGLMKTSVSAHEFTKDNRVSTSLHTNYSTGFGDGQKNFFGLLNGDSGKNWEGCGLIPSSNTGSTLFGNDEYYEYYGSDTGLKMGLGYSWGQRAGVFCRSFLGFNYYGYWSSSNVFFGFRCAGYAP